MVETTENQICSPFYLFKPYLLCVAILVPSIVLTSFLGLGFYVILFTTTILILSTSFLVKFTKKRKVVLVESPAPTNLQVEDEAEEKELQPVLMKTVSDAAQEADVGIVHEFQVDESLDLTSESESSDDSGSSENLELNWMISGNVEQNPEISDDSTSEYDEEGLIEIAIPGNGSIGLSEEPKQNLQSNLPTFLPESSIFKQQDLVELLAEINEVNEEENLIEIDISMGSIKCPTFEIEA